MRMALPLLFALLGANASAEDFSFTVPFDATNLPPEIRFMRVACSVWQGGTPIGSGQYRVAVAGGVARGEAIVTFNATKGQDPKRATRWTCGLIFDEDEAGEKSFAFSDPSDSFPTVSRSITAQGDIER
ncbi:MAG: hypothetical protein EXR36_03295 [Betaproteobacteria bacterium]|nr:hypothetical protein [Betaproteobacteria bacterium]